MNGGRRSSDHEGHYQEYGHEYLNNIPNRKKSQRANGLSSVKLAASEKG